MKKLILIALLAIIVAPFYARADGPRVDDVLRTMVSDGQYASRVENNMYLGWGPFYGADIFDWSRTGLTKVTPKKSVRQNFGNNEANIGVDLWKGFGFGYQRSDWFEGRSINRIGLFHRLMYRDSDISFNAYSRLMVTDDLYWFRAYELITLKVKPIRFFVNDRFIWEQGQTYQINNKLTTGIELTKNVAIIYQRQSITGKPSDNRAGLQLTFGFGGDR